MAPEISMFLKENYFLVFYALAFALSLLRYNRYFDSLLKYFPIIIAYTLISEFLGYFIRVNDNLQIIYIEGYSFYNQLIFNIFDIVFFLYFFYVFSNALINLRFKNWIKYGAVLFIISSIINPFFQDFLLFPQLIASTVGSIVLIISILLYLFGKKSIANVTNHQNLLFWISIGLLLFYSFYPFILLIGYFDYGLYQKLHMLTILHVLIAVMYSCFILGFIFMKRFRPIKEF